MITLKDEYTVTLGVVALTAYIVRRFLVPPALVHPLLLGRQSHVGQVRKRNESATYSNYGIGSSPLPISPGRGITTQLSLLKLESDDASKERWLWDTKITNAQLNARITKMGASLCTAASLVPRASRVMMLLDGSLEWLVADLALAAYCIPTITVASPDLIDVVLEAHPPNAIIVQATFLEQLLELLNEKTHVPVVIVVGDRTGLVAKWSSKVDLKLMSWEQVANVSSDFPLLMPTPGDISNAYFYAADQDGPRGTQFTNQNIVAGTTSIINILPTTGPWSEIDTVISGHPLGSPYGKSILYAALYTGASFATLPSANILKEDNVRADVAEVIRAAEHQDRSPPTILFTTPAVLQLLTSSVLTFSKKSLLFWLGWRHKYAALLQGYSSRTSVWDTLVFGPARTRALGQVTPNLRAIVVAEDATHQTSLLNARLALSVPVVNAFSHSLSTSPIFASHPLDMQILDTTDKDQSDSKKAHTGPPSCNIEVKLLELNEDAVTKGADPEGELCIRGPGVGDPIPMGVQLEEGWVDVGVTAGVRSNGTFVIGARRAY